MEGTTYSYLQRPIRGSVLVPLLVLVVLFRLGTEAALGIVFVLVAGFGILLLAGSSRLVGYLTLIVAVAVFVFVWVFSVGNGPQDRISDRDDQLEIASRALMDGENPWRPPIPSGNPNSTGPASILVAIPFVAATGDIRPLTLLFYVTLFGFLLAGDLRQRNESFPLVVLIFLAGVFGLEHTMVMALDDLYFGYVWLAVAWLLVRGGYPLIAGVCVAFAVLTRLSYGFPVFAFIFWFLEREQYRPAPASKLLAGVVLGLVLIMIPLAVTAGPDLLEKNPLGYNMLGQSWPDTNLIFGLLSWFFGSMHWLLGGAVKTLLALVIMWFASRAIYRRVSSHPFWHLCMGGFTAHMVVYIPDLLYDYMPFFVLPGLLAIAHSDRNPSSGPPSLAPTAPDQSASTSEGHVERAGGSTNQSHGVV